MLSRAEESVRMWWARLVGARAGRDTSTLVKCGGCGGAPPPRIFFLKFSMTAQPNFRRIFFRKHRRARSTAPGVPGRGSVWCTLRSGVGRVLDRRSSGFLHADLWRKNRALLEKRALFYKEN